MVINACIWHHKGCVEIETILIFGSRGVCIKDMTKSKNFLCVWNNWCGNFVYLGFSWYFLLQQCNWHMIIIVLFCYILVVTDFDVIFSGHYDVLYWKCVLFQKKSLIKICWSWMWTWGYIVTHFLFLIVQLMYRISLAIKHCK